MTAPAAPSVPGKAAVGADRAAGPWVFVFHGYRVALTLPDAAARVRLMAIFRHFGPVTEPPDPATPQYALHMAADEQWEMIAAGEARYRTAQLDDAITALEWQIVTDTVAARRDCFHLHAASLADPARAAALLVAGVSGSGKTTLTLGLVARGLLPYSDDTTFIAPETGTPAAFPRAFHADGRTQSLLEALSPSAGWAWDFARQIPGYYLPPRWEETPYPVRTILFPTLRPGASPCLTPLVAADAAAHLLPFSVTLARDPALALRTAARLVAQARCYALDAGDLAATVDLVRDRLARDAARED